MSYTCCVSPVLSNSLVLHTNKILLQTVVFTDIKVTLIQILKSVFKRDISLSKVRCVEALTGDYDQGCETGEGGNV